MKHETKQEATSNKQQATTTSNNRLSIPKMQTAVSASSK
jgi:hypothetical protein